MVGPRTYDEPRGCRIWVNLIARLTPAFRIPSKSATAVGRIQPPHDTDNPIEPWSPIKGGIGKPLVPAVRTQFPDQAVHVVQPPGIWLLLANRLNERFAVPALAARCIVNEPPVF